MALPKLPTGGNSAYVQAAAASSGGDALFGTSRDFPQVVEIDLLRITPNPNQPRKRFDEDDLRSLAASIETHGLKQPILVMKEKEGRYLLVAGERRFRAHQLLKRPTIFAIITEGDADEIALIENLQRVDLDLLELSDKFSAMAKRDGYTHERLAALAGRSRTEVTSILGLQRLSPTIRAEVEAAPREISKSILFEIAVVQDHTQQEALWAQVKSGMRTTELRRAKKSPATGGQQKPVLRIVATSRRLVREIEAACEQRRDGNDGAVLDQNHREELSRLRSMIDKLLDEDKVLA